VTWWARRKGAFAHPTIQISNSHVVRKHAFTISPHVRASHAINLLPQKQRAQGMPGARCARSLVCEMKKHTSIVTTVTPETPGIPRAMVLTVSFELSPVIGLFCHRHRRIFPPT